VTRKADDPALSDSFLERTQAGDLFSAAHIARHPLPVSWFSDYLDFPPLSLILLRCTIPNSCNSFSRLATWLAEAVLWNMLEIFHVIKL
jgi:hypothetical protein